MIVTITMNPSIDISYPLDTLSLDQVNRAANVSKTAGGKGLNVTRVLHELGGEVLATGVIGGFHGDYVKYQLDNEGIVHDFSTIQGETRNSIAVLHEGKQTEILEAGPTVSEKEQEQFLSKYQDLLKQADVLTISGSLAKGFDSAFYSELIRQANTAGVKVLLDTSGQALKDSLLSLDKPFLIKPNTDELTDLIGKEVVADDIDSLKEALSHELFEGLPCIMVSMGSSGAIVKYEDIFYRLNIPKVTAINPVGSGDATIAGLAYGIDQNKIFEDTLKTAMTTGVLNAMEQKTGHIDMKKFDEIYNQVTIEKI